MPYGFSPYSGGMFGPQNYGGGYGMSQGYGGGFGGGYGGGYQMQMPRMMQAFGNKIGYQQPPMPTQAPQQQFSAGGGDPKPSLGGDNFGQQPPTYTPPVQTGGPDPYTGNSAPPQNAMAMQLQNIGGYGMQKPGVMPTQNQYSTGGGDPNESRFAAFNAMNAPQSQQTGMFAPQQVQQPQTGGGSPMQDPSGLRSMTRIPASQAPAPYGGTPANWQDRPIGPMRQGPAPPMAPQQTPSWAAGNPMMWNTLNAGANPYWQQINDARYNSYGMNPWSSPWGG